MILVKPHYFSVGTAGLIVDHREFEVVCVMVFILLFVSAWDA